MRHTKIVATVGPASSAPETIEALLAAVDVFRLNFSHGTHASHAESFARIRESARKHARHGRLLPDGAVAVFVNVSPDLTRADANFLNVQKLE